MNRDILPDVIFSPGYLAIDLAEGLQAIGNEVILFTPGQIDTSVSNITSDLSLFEEELRIRNTNYLDLLKNHPLIFITLARQVQAEIIARVFKMANENEFDIVHIYTNEEELGLVFSDLCNKPVVFTHHEPFNFLAKYKNVMPKYSQKNWISISDSQRKSLPGANFVATIYHGMHSEKFAPNYSPTGNYFAYFGRIIEPKGVHLAIQAAKESGVELRIAGKHYAGYKKDKYWSDVIEPQIDNIQIKYVGFIKTDKEKQDFLGNAKGVLVPSIWEEPFGMVIIESLACGTPVIGLNSGAIPEIINEGENGYIIKNDENSALNISKAILKISNIDRKTCRKIFEKKFLIARMCEEHLAVYKKLTELLDLL